MDRKELENEYANRRRVYERLAEEAAHILQNGLTERQIKFQSVLTRIKGFSSFADKVQRREATKPFEEIVDLVGLRIVCLLRSDLNRVSDLIRESFEVVLQDDKLETQPVASFGYLGIHFVAKMKNEFRGPRYDGLHDVRFEIQVRTIAMDAWAAVSHYLDYKTDVDVPTPLRKDFQALSGLFYLADTHFEMFYKAREESREAAERLFDEPSLATDQELNYDTLAALLRQRYPSRESSDSAVVSELLSELSYQGYKTIASLTRDLDRSRKAFERLEKADPPKDAEDGCYADVGVVRMSLAIANPRYRDSEYPEEEGPTYERWEEFLE